MNTALANVFLKAMSAQVHASFQQCLLRKPNIVFVDLFLWFVKQYGTTTAEDCKANQQHMAANWHPTKGFDALILHLFTGAAFASSARFKMNDVDIVDIGLCIIKQCGMYGKEYKAWITCEAIHPHIVKTFDTFKTFWAAKIMLVNQTAIPASLLGYGMAAVNDDNSIISYSKLIANFGAAYAATQESVKAQGTTIALMQGQLQAMQQYCMALQQQPPLPSMCRSSNHVVAAVWGVNLLPAADIRPQRTPSPDLAEANARSCHPPPSNGLRIGTTAACMAGTSTTPTPTHHARIRGRRTT
jgi:hypothetical protein